MTEARNTAETWQRRAEKAEAAIAEVRKKHTICETKRGAVCRQCEDPWPCPTIRAIEGELRRR